MGSDGAPLLAALPRVDRVLEALADLPWRRDLSRRAVHEVLDTLRDEIRSGRLVTAPTMDDVVGRGQENLGRAYQPSGQLYIFLPVIELEIKKVSIGYDY